MLTITPQVVSITGTANEITADVPNGAVTLSTPQAIGTGSSPTFAGLTISGLSQLPTIVGGSGTTSPLTLRATTGVGVGGADIIFQIGNNGATEAMRLRSGYLYQNGQTAFGMYQVDMTGVVNNGSLALKGTYPVGFFMCSVYNGDGINRTLLAATRSGACSIVNDPSGTWEVNTTTPAAGHQSIVLDALTGILTFYNKSGATTSASGAVLFIQ